MHVTTTSTPSLTARGPSSPSRCLELSPVGGPEHYACGNCGDTTCHGHWLRLAVLHSSTLCCTFAARAPSQDDPRTMGDVPIPREAVPCDRPNLPCAYGDTSCLQALEPPVPVLPGQQARSPSLVCESARVPVVSYLLRPPMLAMAFRAKPNRPGRRSHRMLHCVQSSDVCCSATASCRSRRKLARFQTAWWNTCRGLYSVCQQPGLCPHWQLHIGPSTKSMGSLPST